MQPVVKYGFEAEPKDKTAPQCKQVHGKTFHWVNRISSSIPDGDAVLTNQRELPIYVFSADCLPVLLYTDHPDDPVAAIHAGWRGAMRGVVSNTLRELLRPSRGTPRAVLGPCLGPCCFEVKEDFVAEFERERGSLESFLEERKGALFFNLAEFVKKSELTEVSPDRIDCSNFRCTFCSQPALPSYRRNKGTDPRIRSWILKV